MFTTPFIISEHAFTISLILSTFNWILSSVQTLELENNQLLVFVGFFFPRYLSLYNILEQIEVYFNCHPLKTAQIRSHKILSDSYY